MIKSRAIAAVVAALLAIVGTVILLSYAHKAAATTASAPETIDVLVAADSIPAGTPAARLTKLVKSIPMPITALLPGRITDLSQLVGKVAVVPMVPGEQLLAGKFGVPPTATHSTAVKIPPGFQQLTILLRPEQVLAGHLAPGDTVGVFISLGAKSGTGARTHLTAQKVLVTLVEPQITYVARSSTPSTTAAGATPSAVNTASDSSAETSTPSAGTVSPFGPDPTSNVLVTLATSAHVAEQIVFGAEHGSIWLSNEPLTANEDGTEIVDESKVYDK